MNVLVVGAGVIGLTSALELARAGARVRVVCRERPEDSTSAVAAAMWYPYEAYPEERVTPWALRSLEVFRELARDPATGVTLRAGVDLVDASAPELTPPAWARALDARELRADEVPAPFVAGRRATVPIIETPIYLAWLESELARLGVSLETRDVTTLADLEGEADAVVLAVGLGARELCNDRRVFPIQGQLVRVRQFGLDDWEVFRLSDAEFGYVIPRSNDVVLGGTNVPGASSLEPDAEVTEAILRRCIAREPRLAGRDVLGAAVGLRPGRTEVRLEAATLRGGTPIVHCYGHGGAGVTLSIGCAEEVRDLVLGAEEVRDRVPGKDTP